MVEAEAEGKSRPSASGHRFGPDLACTECGVSWDEHQGDPQPCDRPSTEDVFARRPEPTSDDDPSEMSGSGEGS